MGASKSDEFSVKDNVIANYAKALSHPARVMILKYLIRKRTCVCGEIVLSLPLSQSTVSQHLKALKDSGLIKGNIEGKKSCYCIDGKKWNIAKKHMGVFFDDYKGSDDDCC